MGWSQGVQDVAAYAAAFNGEMISAYVLADARFETIDDAGHAVFIDQPERFHALRAEFIAG